MRARFALIVTLTASIASAQTPAAPATSAEASAVLASIDQRAAVYRDVALKIWSLAEVGY